MKKKPNILIFNPDQMRADSLGHLGNPAAQTPYLDQFVETDAVSFRNAFCQNPVCVPSRCSFLTGWYPHVAGHRTMHHMLHRHEPNLFQQLRANGYYVWLSLRNDFLPAQMQNYYAGYADQVENAKICQWTKREKLGSKFLNKIIEQQVHKILTKDDPARGYPNSDTYYSFFKGKVDPSKNLIGDNDENTVQEAIKFIKHHPKKQPFCAFVAISAPHPDYAVEEPYYSMIDRKKLPSRIPTPSDWKQKPRMLEGLYNNQKLHTWTEERWDELRATYLGMVAKVDHYFGQLVKTLKSEGLYDDTAIFVLSDHGDFTGDYGIVEKDQNTFEDCLTRVPLLIKPPKGFNCQPGIRENLVELIDFYGTIEEYAGFTSTHDHFGKSLQRLVAGEKILHREAVFCEGGRRIGETQAMEISSNPTNDPRQPYNPRMKLQRNEEGIHGKAVMCRTKTHKFVYRMYEQSELYDLTKDPFELQNVIEDQSYSSILQQLKDRILAYFVETGDVVPKSEDMRFGGFEFLIFARRLFSERLKKIFRKK